MPGVLEDTEIFGILPAAIAEFRALTHGAGSKFGLGKVGGPGGGKPADHSVHV